VNAKVLAAVCADEAPGVPAVPAVPAESAVVVALGGESEVNEMLTVWDEPPASPKASWHETPAASCSGVGGQGYFAASSTGFDPALSAAGQLTG
jgi:hypothetical protein